MRHGCFKRFTLEGALLLSPSSFFSISQLLSPFGRRFFVVAVMAAAAMIIPERVIAQVADPSRGVGGVGGVPDAAAIRADDHSAVNRSVSSPTSPSTSPSLFSSTLTPLPNGPLRSDELLLVYNGNDPESRELAEYYSTVRDVPLDHLCPLNVKPNQEEISRDLYDRQIRDPIRAFLRDHPRGGRIRCVVLFYGMPIRVGPKKIGPTEKKMVEQWQQEFHEGLDQLEQVVKHIELPGTTGVAKPPELPGAQPPALPGSTTRPLEPLGESKTPSKPATSNKPTASKKSATQPASRPASSVPDDLRLAQLVDRYRAAGVALQKQLQQTTRTPADQQQYKQFLEAIQAVEGQRGLLARLQFEKTPEGTRVASTMVEQIRATEAKIAEARAKSLDDPARDEARPLIRQNYGLMGYLNSFASDLSLLRTDETQASVDNELNLLWWEPYTLYRWMPNLLSWNVRAEPGRVGVVATEPQRRTPTLMTCRIDGPSAAVARRIIDESIAVEKTGLTGKVYLDARGLKGKVGHAEYDQDLRDLAEMLKRYTSLEVTLDDRDALFPPGSCHDAMLYCGWYSVRKYVKSCTFVPGAVGYHIASFEAVSLKMPGETGWVRGLLNDGLNATLGPVAEPYLASFPRPTQFFGLLLTGRFSLAECYAYTSDMNSWMMLFIGDPLYRPFGKHPQLTLEQVFPAERIPPEFR